MDAASKYQTRVEISEDSEEILAELSVIKEISDSLGIAINKTDPNFPRADYSSNSRLDADILEYYNSYWDSKIKSYLKEKF